MQDWTPRAPLARRLREIQHEIEATAADDAERDEALKAMVTEGFDTLESYARFIVFQNVKIYEAIMQLAENTGTAEQLAALTERLKAADKKFDTQAPDA